MTCPSLAMTFSHTSVKEWIPRQKNCSFLRPTIHRAKYSLLRKNGGVMKIRAASIVISDSPKELSPLNMASGITYLV